MAKLRLTLLGGFEARTDSGLSLAIPRKKAQMLLAYLAMHPKQTHLRDKLATLLLDDAPAEQARLSLRQTLFAIRHALPSDPVLLEGDSVAFAAEAVNVDVSEFELASRSDDPEKLERAAALYQGDLLEGISPGPTQFEEWLRAERERLHELALEALAKLLAHRIKLGATEPAIETALRLLSLDPLQEVTHRALMSLHACQGRRAAALRQYQLCVDILQRELGVEPEEATKQVYRELLPQTSPRLAAPPAAPHLLPPPRRRRLRAHRRSRSVTSPLIGRDSEVDRLIQALVKACASHGQAIAVLGEAGIGKTRLITALREATAGRGARALIGQSHETERLLAFGPWVQAIREAGFVEGRALDGLGAGWIADLSFLFPELRQPEWPLPSEAIEALRLFDAMTELVKSLAARRPVVLVLEDLHWADEMSVRLFSFLGRRLEGHRILLVGTVREEELDGASPVRRMFAELAQEERLIRLAVAPLSREHTRELVRSLARRSSADEASLTRLEDRVWTLSEGNPFVIVESLREALDTARRSSLPDLPAVPEKVRELILGRFERLSDAGQHLLATAAVIGRDFEFRLLQRAADLGEAEATSGVEALVRTHILHSVGERFDFTHDRLREVAYDRLLPTRRRMLHARVVAALEDVYAGTDTIEPVRWDRLGEHVEQLGYHAVRGELHEKAVPYLRRAGVKAAAQSANRQAVVWFDQALSALDQLPETRAALEQAFDIWLGLRRALGQLADVRRVRECLREAEAIAEKLDDDRRRGRVYALMTNLHTLLGEMDEAVASGVRALAIAERLDDLGLRLLTTSYLVQQYHQRGEYERAIELATANLASSPPEAIYEHLGGVPMSVADRSWLVLGLAELGRFAEAMEPAEEAIAIAEATHNQYTIGFAHMAAGMLHLNQGDWVKARALLERSASAFRAAGGVLDLPHMLGLSVCALARIGETTEAVGRLREGEQLYELLRARPESSGWAARIVASSLGRASLLVGRRAEAREFAQQALEAVQYHAHRRSYPSTLLLLGDIATHPDQFDVEKGEQYYGKALALAEERKMRPLVAHCHAGLGKLYQRTGKREQAQEHLTTATTMYREMGMTYWLEQAERTSASA
jgi:DNA-binding SARP family transcriptional activator/type II secretory pathway predicted ATPase ExeA